jgi:signal recognition particle GTPase
VLAVLNSWNNDQGEAALEFLIAIWTGRMQLVDEHINELANVDKKNMPEEMCFIIDRIKAAR